jgi:alpha-N-arabinofuranosidase
VKYWEFGNEIFFTLNVTDYVNFLNAFVPALKSVDPSIKIIASGGFDQNWNKTLINSCADIIDFISIHNYEDIGNYQGGVRRYEAYVAELEGVIAASSNPNLKIYMSEWNVSSGIDWRNGLYAGGMLTMFERQGKYMHIAAPALFLRHSSADDWNNALINFNNSSWFPAPNYVVMKFWHDHYAPNFLEMTGNSSSLNVSTTQTEDGQVIYFKVINTSASDIPVQLEIDGSFQLRAAILEQIVPGSLSAVNSMSNPNNIHVEIGNVEIDSGQVHFTIPRYAGVIVTLSQNPNLGLNDDNSIDMIKDFNLYQNYPNPFNSITQIKYSIPKNSYITLKVYNLLGEEVTTLFEGYKQRGNYTATFDASGLSSGIYLSRMTADNPESSLPAGKAGSGQVFTDTKKIILLK